MKTAVITGASAGVGREFALALPCVFPEIECLWLIARSAERLEEVAGLIPDKKVVCVSLDLTNEASFATYQELLERDKPDVTLLINNAGCGYHGNFEDDLPERHIEVVDLNIRALTAMTRLTLPFMPNGARIINLSSIASFVPNPGMTVYSASKAYVSAFSRGLNEELRGRKISVTAPCPPPMLTGFLDKANITGNSKAFETLPYCEASDVAKASLVAAKRRRAVYTPKAFYKLFRVLAAIIPHAIFIKFAKV